MEKPIKFGFGGFFILLGLYLINTYKDSVSVIGGIAVIGIGLGIIASK